MELHSDAYEGEKAGQLSPCPDAIEFPPPPSKWEIYPWTLGKVVPWRNMPLALTRRKWRNEYLLELLPVKSCGEPFRTL